MVSHDANFIRSLDGNCYRDYKRGGKDSKDTRRYRLLSQDISTLTQRVCTFVKNPSSSDIRNS